MGAKRVEYTIVGRYMDGKEVTGYHLQAYNVDSLEGKSGRYSREQVIFLVGRGQVLNCTGQLYKDGVLLRGKDMSLEDLPVKQENGTLSRTDNVGKIRRGATAGDVMTQYMIVAVAVNGRNTIGYFVRNAAGAESMIKKSELLEYARQGRIGNARVQNYTDKATGKTQVILKGVNCDLKALPKIKFDEKGNRVAGSNLEG